MTVCQSSAVWMRKWNEGRPVWKLFSSYTTAPLFFISGLQQHRTPGNTVQPELLLRPQPQWGQRGPSRHGRTQSLPEPSRRQRRAQTRRTDGQVGTAVKYIITFFHFHFPPSLLLGHSSFLTQQFVARLPVKCCLKLYHLYLFKSNLVKTQRWCDCTSWFTCPTGLCPLEAFALGPPPAPPSLRGAPAL